MWPKNGLQKKYLGIFGEKNLVFWSVRIASTSYGDVVSSNQSVIDARYKMKKINNHKAHVVKNPFTYCCITETVTFPSVSRSNTFALYHLPTYFTAQRKATPRLMIGSCLRWFWWVLVGLRTSLNLMGWLNRWWDLEYCFYFARNNLWFTSDILE